MEIKNRYKPYSDLIGMFILPSSLLIIPLIIIITIIISKRDHFLIILLMLEALVLILVRILILNSIHRSRNRPFLIIFILTIGATEASIGLSLLVMLTRLSGRDKASNLLTLKC